MPTGAGNAARVEQTAEAVVLRRNDEESAREGGGEAGDAQPRVGRTRTTAAEAGLNSKQTKCFIRIVKRD